MPMNLKEVVSMRLARACQLDPSNWNVFYCLILYIRASNEKSSANSHALCFSHQALQNKNMHQAESV